MSHESQIVHDPQQREENRMAHYLEDKRLWINEHPTPLGVSREDYEESLGMYYDREYHRKVVMNDIQKQWDNVVEASGMKGSHVSR